MAYTDSEFSRRCMIEGYVGLEILLASKTAVGLVIQIFFGRGDGYSCAAVTVIRRIDG